MRAEASSARQLLNDIPTELRTVERCPPAMNLVEIHAVLERHHLPLGLRVKLFLEDPITLVAMLDLCLVEGRWKSIALVASAAPVRQHSLNQLRSM